MFKNTRKKYLFCLFVGNLYNYNKKSFAYFAICVQNSLRILLNVIQKINVHPQLPTVWWPFDLFCCIKLQKFQKKNLRTCPMILFNEK